MPLNQQYLYSKMHNRCRVIHMNVNIGTPYESIIQKIIDKEYAGNQTEAIRQALLAYERLLENEEQLLVKKAIVIEITESKANNDQGKTFEEMKKKFKW